MSLSEPKLLKQWYFHSLEAVEVSAKQIAHRLSESLSWPPYTVNFAEAEEYVLATYKLDDLIINPTETVFEGYRLLKQPDIPYPRYWETVFSGGKRINSEEIVGDKHIFLKKLVSEFSEKLWFALNKFLYYACAPERSLAAYDKELYSQLFKASMLQEPQPRLIPCIQLPPEEEIYTACSHLFQPLPWQSYNGETVTLDSSKVNHGLFVLEITGERGEPLFFKDGLTHPEALRALVDHLYPVKKYNKYPEIFYKHLRLN